MLLKKQQFLTIYTFNLKKKRQKRYCLTFWWDRNNILKSLVKYGYLMNVVLTIGPFQSQFNVLFNCYYATLVTNVRTCTCIIFLKCTIVGIQNGLLNV